MPAIKIPDGKGGWMKLPTMRGEPGGVAKYPYDYIYVNATSGNDNNDGATSATAIKTLKSAAARLYGRAGYVELRIAAGDYRAEGAIEFFSMGSLEVHGAGSATTLLPETTFVVYRYLQISGINFISTKLENCGFVYLYSSLYNTSGKQGLYITNSIVDMESTKFYNQTTAIRLRGSSSSLRLDTPSYADGNNTTYIDGSFGTVVVLYPIPATNLATTLIKNSGATIIDGGTGYVNAELTGIMYADKGTHPDYTGVKYKLVVVDGKPMLEVI